MQTKPPSIIGHFYYPKRNPILKGCPPFPPTTPTLLLGYY